MKLMGINGDGWRFTILEDRLYFYSGHKSWDYKLKDLSIDTDFEYVCYIKLKNSRAINENYFFRMYVHSMFNTDTTYADRWQVNVETYRKIRNFLMNIESLTYG